MPRRVVFGPWNTPIPPTVGLAVLFGIWPTGRVVSSRPAGVGEDNLVFSGPARVFESQEDAVSASSEVRCRPATLWSSVTKVPRRPRDAGDAAPDVVSEGGVASAQACALVTDGRFSGGTSGPVHRARSPEAAGGGVIGLVVDGDLVELDIPNGRSASGCPMRAGCSSGSPRRSATVRSRRETVGVP